MGWAYEYLKEKSKANSREICPKSKKKKPHKLDTWCGVPYCKRCGTNLR